MPRSATRPASTFTLTRRGDANVPATITYEVVGITAAPEDFQDRFQGGFPRGAVQFASGETSKTLAIAPSNSAVTGRTFKVRLTGATPASTASGTDGIVAPDSFEAQGAILPDPDPHFAIEDGQPVAATENGGRPGVSFRVTKTEGMYVETGVQHTAASTVSWRVIGIDAQPVDFGGAFPAGTVDFDRDQAEAFIVVTAPDSPVTPNTPGSKPRSPAGRRFRVVLEDATPGIIDVREAIGAIPARVEVGIVYVPPT